MKRPRCILTGLISSALLLPWLSSAPAQTDAIWTGGTGNWSNAALWSPAGVPNGVPYNVLLDNGNAANSIVDLDMWATVGGLTIDAGDMLRINNGNRLILSGATVNNAGTILINPNGSTTYLFISGTVNLQGAGKLTLGGSGHGVVSFAGGPATDTLNSAQTIEGFGAIDVLLNNQAAGVVDANVGGGGLTLYRATTNAGTLRASNGGTLNFYNIAVANTGGVITATSGSTVNLNASTITGGTLTNSGGTINSGAVTHLVGTGAGGITLNGTYTLGNGAQTRLVGTMNNNGLINFASGGSTTYLLIDGSVNLQGSGKITMGGTGPNQIRWSSAPASDTLNSYQTIEGHGTFDVLLNNTAGQLVDANISGATLALARATTNAGTLRASGGGTLSLNGIAVANTGSVITATSGGIVDLNDSTITGGTLTNAGGTINSGNVTHLIGTGAGITLNGTYTLGNGAQTRLVGTMNNNGLINFVSGGSTTYLFIDGSVNLQGSGKITMGGVGPNQIRWSSAPASDILNSYQTIEGKGTIDVLLNNTAGKLVDANISGQALTLNRATTNDGTLRASGGGTLSLAGIAVANTGGVITATSGGIVNLNDSTITGGTLTNSGGTINSGNVTHLIGTGAGITLNGTYTLGNGAQTRLVGTMNNNGLINYASSGSTAYLFIDGTVNLQGGGKITMGGVGPNQIRWLGGPASDTLSNSQTIEGKGTVDVIVNNQSSGLVNANLTGQTLTLARDLTNTGTLQASGGGTLGITTTTITNIGGTIQALSGSSVNLASGATINGGTVQNIGGTISIGSGVILDGTHAAGITLAGNLSEPNGGSTTLLNTIHNTGSISLNSAGSSTLLLVGGAGADVATLLDGGTITLGATGTGSILAATTNGNRLINENNTIQGQGTIGNTSMKLTNRGLILANVPGGTLVVNPLSGAGNVVNTGTMRASTGSTLFIQSSIANTDGVTGGIVEATAGGLLKVQSAALTGGMVQTVGAGEIQLHTATVTGGSLLNSSTGIIRAASGQSIVNGLNNAAGGQVLIDNGAQLRLQNTVQNAGTIQFNASGSTTYLFIDGSVTLQGAGKVMMGGTGPNQLHYSDGPASDILNSAQTIEGFGAIDVLLNNQAAGVVDANITGATLTFVKGITNAGTLRASNGGTLSLAGIAVANTGGVNTATSGGIVNLNDSTITGGTLINSGGTINSGNVTHLIGTGAGITLNGTYTLGNGAQTRLVGTMNNNGLINFASSGSTAYLFIDGTVNLQGGGKITMGGVGPNQIRWLGGPASDTLSNSQTIEGYGTMDVILNNQSSGLVNANLSGQTLTLARDLTNTGILQASGGGTLSTSPAVVTNIGGIIQAITGGTVNFNTNTRIDGGTVRNIGSTMTFGSNAIFDGTHTLGITLQGDFSIPNGVILALLNTVHNHGTISVNPSGSTTYLQIGGDGTGVVTLDSSGSILLAGPGATISASTAGNRLVNQDNTISGQGSIGAGNMKLTNGGLILANVSGQTLTVAPQAVAGAGVNVGIMRASGGGILTIQNTINNSGGLIESTADGLVNVSSGLLDGGVVQTVGTGEIRLLSGQILNGSLNNSATGIIRSASGTSRINTLNNVAGGRVMVDNATTLALQGTLTNNGSISVNGTASTTGINIEGTVTLLGTGTVTLGGSNNRISFGTDSTADLLVNPNQTIQGAGGVDVRLTNQPSGIVDASVSGQTLTLGRAITNTGLLEATAGVLSLDGITVTNTDGTIRSIDSGVVNLNSSTIIGGTISSFGAAVNSGNVTHLVGTGAGITLNGTYTLGNAAQTRLVGTVNNNGLINYASNGSTAYLFIDGSVNLQGSTGKVTMGGTGPNQIRWFGAPASDILNSYQTIEGKGTIDVLLNNTAGKLVDANISGQGLTLNRATTNDGFLRASGGGTLSLAGIAVANTGGVITATSGGIVDLNDSTITGGTLTNSGGAINSGAVTHLIGTGAGITVNGTYKLGNGAQTRLTGTINNNGLINFASSGSTAYVLIDGSVNLQGSGKVTMGDTGPNQIRYSSVPGSDILNSYQTIEGKGTIDVLLNNTAGQLVDAKIDGQTLGLSRATINGAGSILQASGGGTLSLNNIAVANIGATIQAVGFGSTVQMNASTIYGGTIINASGSIFSGTGTFLDGSVTNNLTIQGTYTLGNGAITALKGTINNQGVIDFDSLGSTTYLMIDGTVNLQGTGGNVRMDGNGPNQIRYNAGPASDGLNNFQTIQGRGSIDVIMDNKLSGIVTANISGQTLLINRDVTNRGVLRAEDGGLLSINGIGASTGQIDSRSGSQVIFNSSSFLLDQGTTITGVAQTRLISGTTFIGDSQGDIIPTSNFLVAGGTLTGPGTMNVSGGFTLTSGIVTGSGDLDFLAGSTNIVNGTLSTIDARPVTNHGTLTLAVDSLTMQGGANLSNHGTLYVQGSTTVNGNANGGSSIDNHDLLRKTNSGTATLNTSFANTSTVEVQSGTLRLNGASISSGAYVVNNDLDFSYLDFGTGTHNLNAGASITGTGQARVNSGGTLNVNATVHAADIALTAGVIQGVGNLIIDRHLYWSAGTFGGSGNASIAAGATMEIATGLTKYLDGRDLRNSGNTNWSGGTIYASNGADFYNNGGGNIGVTGNVTFTRADQFSEFYNNGTLALVTGASLTVNGDFTNNGRVEQNGPTPAPFSNGLVAPATNGSVSVNGNVKGSGEWTGLDWFLKIITLGIYQPRTFSNTVTVRGGNGGIQINNPADTTFTGSVFVKEGATIVAGGGGNMRKSGGIMVVSEGASLIGEDAAGLIGEDGASVTVTGPGSSASLTGKVTIDSSYLTLANQAQMTVNSPGGVDASNGTVIVDTNAKLLVNNGGVLSHNGNQLLATNGGEIVAGGGLNIDGDGGVVKAENGGKIKTENGGQVLSHNGNQMEATAGGEIVAGGGGNIVAGGGGNIVAGGGGNIVAGGGGNSPVSASNRMLMDSAGGAPSTLFTGPMILAQNGGNLIGMTGGPSPAMSWPSPAAPCCPATREPQAR